MLRSPALLASLLLLTGCSTKLVRPENVSLCGRSGCATVADDETRARLLTSLHELFRGMKGRELTLYSADPKTRAEKKRGISFFVQGGPIPGRSTLSRLDVVDVRYIDRARSEIKLELKFHPTYVGIPVFCTESAAVVAASPDETVMTAAPFCSWMAIGNGVFKLQWSIDSVDVEKGVVGGYWSMKGAGVPLVGGGSGYMIARFKEAPPAPKPAPAPVVASLPVPKPEPKPEPLPAPRPAPAPVPAPKPAPVVETVEVVSEAVNLAMTTRVGDAGGDLVFDGGEAISLRVEVENKGGRIATETKIALSGDPVLVACFGEGRRVGAVAPGDSEAVEFACRLPAAVPSETASLLVEAFAGASGSRAAAKRLKIALKPAPVAEEEVVSEVGVDDIPPRSKTAGASANAALVIGLGRYREKAIPAVKYAARDAEVVARYLENVGGVSAENLKVITDDSATKSDLEAYLEDWLPRRVGPESTVFVYYAGHGAPDPAGKESYLVPFEGHPDFPTKLYPLSRMYAALAKLPAKHIVVMLDSCFSGAKGRGVAQEGARPLISAMETASLDPKLTVLAGATGSQITSDYDKAEHGLFTYFLLKGLRGDADADRDGVVNLGELYPFVRENVSSRASRELNRDQTPVLLGGASARALPLSRR